MQAAIPYDQFNSDLHQQWREDRQLRQCVPLSESWRGCLGLAALLSSPDDTEYCGDHALISNENVTWMALRDIPAGCFPGSPRMNRRSVNYVNCAKAHLRYGMPYIDFAQDIRSSWDFRFMPFGTWWKQISPYVSFPVTARGDVLNSDENAREFAVLNRLSRSMTEFAFTAVDRTGNALRPAWSRNRPDGMEAGLPPAPSTWMPQAYLAFNQRDIGRLLWILSQDGVQPGFVCPHCQAAFSERQMAHQLYRVSTIGQMQSWFQCPLCRDKCSLDELQMASASRWAHSSWFLRNAFSNTVLRGLQMVLPEPAVYFGFRDRNAKICQATEVASHSFKGLITGRRWASYAPKSARLHVKIGQEIEAGHVWCETTAPSHPAPQCLDIHQRWAFVSDWLGGSEATRLVQHAWLRGECLSIASRPELRLLPAQLVWPAVRQLAPIGLWWDLQPGCEYFDGHLQAGIFPPLRLRKWQRLQICLPGQIAIDANIADPRFEPSVSLPAGAVSTASGTRHRAKFSEPNLIARNVAAFR